MKKIFKIFVIILLILLNYKLYLINIYKNIPLLYYVSKKEQQITLYSFNLNIEKYLEQLETCYDESKYYDKKNNYSIINYEIKKNKIILNITKENLCEKQYVLEDNWISSINNINMIINTDDIDKVFKYIKTLKRIEFKNNMSVNEEAMISVFYEDKVLHMFEYENKLAVKITDENDHSKNAIYDIKYEEFLKEIQ